eukprot:4749181-Pyramimonas_sp.AAC.1
MVLYVFKRLAGRTSVSVPWGVRYISSLASRPFSATLTLVVALFMFILGYAARLHMRNIVALHKGVSTQLFFIMTSMLSR